MIRGELQNDSLFFTIIRDYLNRYKNDVVFGEDFKLILEEKTNRDFSAFFNQWYYGEGYPIYSINYKQNENDIEITAFQTTSMPAITPLFKMHLPYKIFFNDGTDSTIILLQENNHFGQILLPVEYLTG